MPPIIGIYASSYRSAALPTGSYDALAVYTVPSGGASSITFAGIPQSGYQHLQLRIMGQANSNSDALMQFNGDTTNSNYYRHYLAGWSNSAQAGADAAPYIDPAGLFSGYPGAWVIDILDFTNTNKYKTSRILFGYDNNSADAYSRVGLVSTLWKNTNAITQITIATRSWSQYSSFALYGIRG